MHDTPPTVRRFNQKQQHNAERSQRARAGGVFGFHFVQVRRRLQLGDSPHALSSCWTEAGRMPAHDAAPGSEGTLERFIAKCALTSGASERPPLFYTPRRGQSASPPEPARSPARWSAVFRCLGDCVTHPGVRGLGFRMRNAIAEMFC